MWQKWGKFVAILFGCVGQILYLCTIVIILISLIMERITILKKTKKTEGKINIRFRLRDGRKADLSHKSEISADLKDLSKFDSDCSVKKGISIYNKNLKGDLDREIGLMRSAYSNMISKGLVINGETFESEIAKLKYPQRIERNEDNSLLGMFRKFYEKSFDYREIGELRLNHYAATERILKRYLIIIGQQDITPPEVTGDMIMDIRTFMLNESDYVEKYPHLYAGLKDNNVPTEHRSANTVSTKMKELQKFFQYLEDEDTISKSPFRKLGKTRRTEILKQEYQDPIFLRKDEFLLILNSDVPDMLRETKRTFLLQCALGCRIGDFKRLSMNNVSVSEGIPYVYYVPSKTIRTSKDEIQTPLMRYALDIIKDTNFSLPILKNISGHLGYNEKIKRLLKHCGIDRICKVFDEQTKQYTDKPLYEFGSSKLARKTIVDLMNKVQINKYAAGLHKIGSDAVDRYTSLELRDRFALMCNAFSQPIYKVDNDLNVISD